MQILQLFRITAVSNVLILLAQSAFAGAMLGGNVRAAHWHERTAQVLVLLALFQFLLTIAMRRKGQSPLWMTAASGVLLGAEVLEFAAGHLHYVALHVPLGVAIFGGALRQTFWAVRERAETAPCYENDRIPA